MFQVYKEEIEYGGRKLILETGKVARQADGAVLVTYGETQVLCTVVAAKTMTEDQDWFPLSVHYQEKSFAAGKIPGGFFKREGRPSEKEVLTSRLIDRPIRPLFVEGFMNEVQVICTVLSHDLENDPDIPSIIGTSAALTLSGVPFLGPIAAARVGWIKGKYLLNPSLEEIKDSDLDLVVAGTGEGVLMVESEAKQLSEDVMLGAVDFGHKEMQVVINAIINLAEQAARDAWDFKPMSISKDVEKLVEKEAKTPLKIAYNEIVKQTRSNMLSEAREKVMKEAEEKEFNISEVNLQLKKVEKNLVRGQVLKNKKRIDGRDLNKVRPINAEVGILHRAHGSALFTRGETQGLVVTTLGTGHDEQIIDGLEGDSKRNFMLHYNFPPYSVGETGRLFTGRREVGHGMLAWRAIHPLMPDHESFPYTIRIVSEITESNGSSSMATVCGTSLALMDAGVPIKKPVAGIAMGLIKEEKEFVILSDILGDEDHLGDMDFKVAGTDSGITSLQMDIKITSITREIMKVALEQAREGRLHILSEMSKAIKSHRKEVNVHAPRIERIQISVDKIREVIGSGGKVIKEICEVSEAKIDIDDKGLITIFGVGRKSVERALKEIKAIVVEPEVGRIYEGTVVKIMDFGAFVNFLGKRDGLVHISAMAPYHVEKVSDICKEGESVKVKVMGLDDRGKVRLSMKVVDQKTGEDISGQFDEQATPSPKARGRRQKQ
ncbi:MAG: Polyribonucleotide nucleotidyltransferase [Alphaproteobacteria bacterium MarineAlpha9_Bin2]|nr:MAG: Polyribonucleotide nucleotidyltransferase [Alphaproteobacteria bacterium MarineAlpha9_Bin2]